MTSADVIWNLLQMYFAEKEKNSKREKKKQMRKMMSVISYIIIKK